MYAILAAGADGRFVAARDPVGIKPLYWAREGDRVCFASEMAAFEADLRPHIEVFPPGCHWTPEGGLERFAAAVTPGGASSSRPEATRDVLVAAVERQLMGDVPVGVFLSGGLDSSLVAAIAARRLAERGERLQTFAVGTPGSPDLLAAARRRGRWGPSTASGSTPPRRRSRRCPWSCRAIEHFDPSLVRSAVPNFLLAELAARHVKVVLTGEGADELFAGYEYLRGIEDPDALQAELVRTWRACTP
jgi:asparagine synthase (glutamine-hydrolysing)